MKQYSLADKVISGFATIGYAIPSFLIGIYILIFGGVWLAQLTGGAISFPLFGKQSLGKEGDIAGYRLAPGAARDGAGDPVDRRVLALPAGLDARRPETGLRADGQGEGPDRATRSSPSTPCATR